jgi:hypothetical protein
VRDAGPSSATPRKADVFERTSPLPLHALNPHLETELEALTLDAWLRRKSITSDVVLSPTEVQSEVPLLAPLICSLPSCNDLTDLPPRLKSTGLTPAPISSTFGSSTALSSIKFCDAVPIPVPPVRVPAPTVPNPKNWTAGEQEVWQRIKARAPQHRLMEYFLVVGRGSLLSARNGREGIEGLVYSARLQDRYPKCVPSATFISWLPSCTLLFAFHLPNIVWTI